MGPPGHDHSQLRAGTKFLPQTQVLGQAMAPPMLSGGS